MKNQIYSKYLEKNLFFYVLRIRQSIFFPFERKNNKIVEGIYLIKGELETGKNKKNKRKYGGERKGKEKQNPNKG